MHKALPYLIVLTGAYLGVRYLFQPLLPFLIALVPAVLLEPLVQRCRQRLGLKRNFTALSLTTGLLLILCGGLYWLVSRLLTEATGLLEDLPGVLSRLPFLTDGLESRYSTLYSACPQQVRLWLDRAMEHLAVSGQSLIGQISSQTLGWASSLVSGLPGLLLFSATTVLAIYFTALSYPDIASFVRRQLPHRWRRNASAIAQTLRSTFWKWLRAESLLCLLTFCILLLGFLYLHLDYPLLAAALTAIMDALPVLGAGMVLIPWSLYHLLLGSIPRGIALLALYAIVLIARSLAEPRIVAAQVGLPPIAALLAMYLGYRLIGVGGMLLLPIALLFANQLHDSGLVRLWR